MRNRATWLEISLMVVVTIVLLIVCGCQSPVDTRGESEVVAPVVGPPEDPPVPNSSPILINSTWDVVDRQGFQLHSVLSTQDLEAYVESYNATHYDDFLRIYDSDEAPSLDDAPAVSVYIVNPETYEVNWSAENISRRSLVENVAAWRLDSYGQLLFIDHVPPAPIVTTPASMYAHYAIYLVDDNGAVVLEDHCGYLPDESFTGQWITVPEAQGGGGWSSVDSYFDTIVRAYTSEAWRVGWHVITRQLYTAP